MPKQERKGSGGSRKYGRSLVKCKKYRDEHRREKNKKRKMEKLAKKYAKNKERGTRLGG